MENSENGVHLIQISVRDLSMCLTGFLLSVVVKIEKRIRRMFRAEVLTVTSSSAMMDWPVGRGHVTALSCDYVTRSRLFPEYHYWIDCDIRADRRDGAAVESDPIPSRLNQTANQGGWFLHGVFIAIWCEMFRRGSSRKKREKERKRERGGGRGERERKGGEVGGKR